MCATEQPLQMAERAPYRVEYSLITDRTARSVALLVLFLLRTNVSVFRPTGVTRCTLRPLLPAKFHLDQLRSVGL